ncbi:hypothetical protein LJR245_006973 [Rhizobium leguminosarum]|uniref:hypothetical protein n=1 Tax=Rhizobium leguminosarum TaxID=384 RepID=UPI003ECCD400
MTNYIGEEGRLCTIELLRNILSTAVFLTTLLAVNSVAAASVEGNSQALGEMPHWAQVTLHQNFV